jgi:glyoxylase I family protein
MLKFSHIGVSCSDIKKTEQFYTKHFGFSRARFIPLSENDYIIYIKCGSVYLELFKSKSERPIPQPDNDGQNYPGWRHLAFQVDDIEKKITEMGDEAVVSLGPLDFSSFIPGWRTVWVKDPDGNIIEISQGYTDEENTPNLVI